MNNKVALYKTHKTSFKIIYEKILVLLYMICEPFYNITKKRTTSNLVVFNLTHGFYSYKLVIELYEYI